MERDPNGLDPHTPGAKLDAGKQLPVLVLVPFIPVLGTCIKNPQIKLLFSLAKLLLEKSSLHGIIDQVISENTTTRISGLVAVGTYGATKYTPDGWLSVPDGMQRYGEAAARHMLKRIDGEEVDQDSGLPHIDHCLWNMLAYETLRNAQGVDRG